MHQSLLTRQVLPAVLGYLGLIAATILLDFALHKAGLRAIGFYLGPIGTALIALSFIYSLRKRKLISVGQPKKLLELHETLAWTGSLLVLVHAGVHLNAYLPWLALIAMLVVVGSGLTGQVLLKRATEILKSPRSAPPGGEDNTILDAATVDIMKRWRQVHMPINAVFLVLLIAHIGSVLLFWHW
jgi:cytochrome b561